MSTFHGPPPIDHLVLPTADLDVARARLGALGFTVAPDGIHPFGTQNACVYFADGAFLEALAIADGKAADAAVETGNVFVARDRAYRDRFGDEGFSALVLATNDAAADDASFRKNGISAGRMLAFSRPFVNADGGRDMASFRLAFAAPDSVSDSFFFTCERVNTPKADRFKLHNHVNGVTGIARVTLSTSRPAAQEDFFRTFAGDHAVSATSAGVDVKTGNGIISVLDPGALKSSLGIEARDESSLRLQAIVLQVPDIMFAERRFAEKNIAGRRRGDLLIVPPAPGQGATFAFEVSKT